MFFIIGKHARRAIAEIVDFKTSLSEFFHQASRPQGRGPFFGARQKSGGAGTCAYQGNLLRLTDNLDRQGSLLKYLKFRPVLAPPSIPHDQVEKTVSSDPENRVYRRGAGAMVASSGGSVKRTSSRIRSRSR